MIKTFANGNRRSKFHKPICYKSAAEKRQTEHIRAITCNSVLIVSISSNTIVSIQTKIHRVLQENFAKLSWTAANSSMDEPHRSFHRQIVVQSQKNNNSKQKKRKNLRISVHGEILWPQIKTMNIVQKWSQNEVQFKNVDYLHRWNNAKTIRRNAESHLRY
jgi:hypothetical protein